MYQALPYPAGERGGTVRVVLVFDVLAAAPDLPHRTAQLADDFGALIAQTLPGVLVRRAVIDAATTAPAQPAARPTQGLTVDAHARGIQVDGRPIHLTYREFELLSYLMRRPLATISRAELVREVWRDSAPGPGRSGSSRTVDTHIRRLRAKLGPYAGMLTTVRGRGYRCDPGPGTGFRSA